MQRGSGPKEGECEEDIKSMEASEKQNLAVSPNVSTTGHTDSNGAPSISKDASTSKNTMQEAETQALPLDLLGD